MSERNNKQRLRILYLYKILSEYTDEEHSLTMPQIIEKLSEYGITAARKAIYDDIDALKEFGVDIILERGNNTGYCIVNREFEIPELVLLADAVKCSRFFTQKKGKALVRKLEMLCSVYEAKRINSGAFFLGGNTYDNERIYLNVDAIHRAICEKRKISFRYFDYDLKKRKKFRNGLRVCSPYALTWDNNKYYLIAHYEKYGGVSHFRVDKMENVELLNERINKMPVDFDLPDYLKSTFSMFSGTSEVVTLRFKNSLIDAVIDRFGRNIPIVADDEDHFVIKAPIRTSHPETFFGWLFQFGESAEIVKPAELKERYIAMLRGALEKENGK